MFKRVLSVSIIVSMFLVGAAASAQTSVSPSRLQAAARLLEVMNSQEGYDSSVMTMLELQIQQQPALAPYRGVMEAFFRKYASWDSLKGDMAGIYASEFTEKELNDLIAFYRTPTGMKAVNLLPVLFKRGADLGAQRVREHIGELEQMLQEEMARQPQQ